MQHFFSSSFRRSIHRLTRRFRACVTGVVLAATLTTAAQAGITQLSGQTSQYAASNTITSFTVPAGGNRLLVVSTGDPNSKTNPSGVTFNGTAMSLGNSTSDNNISCDSIYYLKIPGTAAVTGDIVVTFSNTGKNYFISAVAFSGVDQTTPVDTNGPKISGSVNATGDSLVVSSQTGSLVFDHCDTYGSSAQPSESPGGSQTLIASAGGSITGGGYARYLTSTQPGASSVTMSWTGNAGYILHLTMNIHPAQISWGAATNISGDTDVSTTGSLVGAFVMGNTGVGSTTVNGVTFQGFAYPAGTSTPVTSGNFTVGASGSNGFTNASANSTSTPFTGLSSAYQALVGGAPFYSGGNITVTLSGLTPGATYALQIWISASNSSFSLSNIMTADDGAGSSVSLKVNKTAAVGDIGQYTSGTFVASSTSQTVTILGSSITRMLNAFQLRQTAAAPGVPTVTGISPSSGSTAGGTAVTITGTGFTGATGVTIGGTAATGVSLVSDTSITCTTPAGTAGTASVLVTTPSGTNAANTLYTYLAPPVAVADGISPQYATPVNQQFGRTAPGVLGNDTLNGGSISSYGASTGAEQTTIGSATATAQGGTIVLNANGSFTYTPPASYSGNDTFKYKLTNGGGSSTATVTIYVDVLPTVSSTVPANNATGVALNSTITINFSEAISTTAAFTVTDTTASSSVAFSQSPTDGNTTTAFTLTPTSALAAGHVITVTVLHNQTADADAGLSMQSDYVFSFTTLPAPSAVNDPDTQGTRYQVVSGVLFDSALSGSPPSILDNDTINGGSLTYGATGPTSNTAVDGTTTITTSNGGTVLLRANGTFTYKSATSYTGNDNFFYNLTNSSGSSRAQVLFTVNPATPTVTSISPTAGPTTGGTPVTITGTNFTGTTGAAGVKFGATNATSYTVDSATQITATAPAGTGTVDVTVTNTGGTSATSAADQFTYVPAPTVTLLTPQRGPSAGGTSVTITGTNLTGVTDVNIGGTAVTGFTIVNSTTITCNTPAGTAGAASVVVSSPGGQNAANSLFTYVDPPTITNSTPIVVAAAGGAGVTLTGTNFTFVQSVTIGGNTVPSISVPNNHTITFNAPAGTPGTYDVVVTTSGGSATSVGLFTYAGVPTVTAISPSLGPVDGGAAVTITGTNFVAPASVKIGGSSATSVVVVNSTTITCVTPSGGPGTPASVVVTTPGGSNGANTLYGYVNAPYINYTGPKSGPTAGGTSVTIEGGNFTGTTSVTFNGVAATLGTVGDSSITCTTPAGTAGTVAIVVVAPGGTTTPDIISQFTYVAPPTVTGLSPNSGPSAGGTVVTVTGTKLTGATAVTFGSTAATNVVVLSDTQVKATAPAGTGTVDVRVTTVGGTSAVVVADQFNYLSATQAIASKTLTQGQPSTNFTPVTGSGGTAPLSYSVSPALPTGLSISSSTGAITGSPTVTSSATTYTVTVTDSNSATASKTFSLTVNGAVTATQAIASKTLTQNQPSANFTPITGAGGTGTLTYGISPALPTGLTLSTSTGAITGVPTGTSSATTYTVTATDSNSATASNTFSLAVSSAVTATQSIASKTLTQNQPSANFTPVTGGSGTAPLSYSISPALPTGLTLSTSTGAITGVPTGTSSATTYTVTVTDSNSATASNSFSLTISSAVTATQAVASKTLTQNQPSTNFTPITGSGGTGSLTYSVSPSLPAGLTLSTSTGAITGTPTAASSATTYTVTVTDSNSATDSKTFSLTVNSAVTATQAIASKTLTQNQPSANFTPITGANGTAPLSYGISPALPTGLTLSTSTGAITGVPTGTSSATTYTVTVTDSNSATASNTFSLTISSAVTATQSIASKTLTQNQPSANFTPITGGSGTTPLSYGVSPALPTGLTLNTSTGAITGSPTGSSTATTYTVTVTDANSATASNTFSLTISSAVTATQAVASTTLAQNQVATSFTPVTGGSGTPSLSYGISPALPTGLTLSTSTGAITGTPSVASAATTYTVTVTDSNSATASNTFSLTVNPGVGIAATTATAVEGGTTGVYTITRGSSSGDLTVNFQLDASSTAVAATDFTLTSSQTLTFNTGSGAGTLVIPDGSSTATITLTALVESPNSAEAAETVRLNLSAGTGYAVNASPADNATVTIAANSFYVTTTSDSGTGSLRQALLNVNTLGGTPTVTFSDGTGGTVNFTDATPDTITLTSGVMQVTSSLVIAGPGANKLTIDGNGARILNLANISSYAISGINFVNGSSNGGSAILSQTFGVTCAGSVVGCSFSQHSTTSFGGAIFHYALSGVTSTMDVIGCSFVQNSAFAGGALSAQGGGGAGGGSAVLRVTNCTFSQNSATYGGSIYSWGLSGSSTVTLINSTFAGGSSANNGTDLLADQNGTIQVGNSILDSTGAAVAAISGGSLVSLGHNITAGSSGPNDHATDLLSTDPLLGTLANNGGTTPTMALLNGSPAINAGSNALLPADTYDLDGDSNTTEAIPFDQRGTSFPRVQGTVVDIGAFEALLYTPTLSATTTNEDTQSSSGLVITANSADAGGTANYKITSITGGTLYKNDGTSAISSGDYITKAEGAAGLKFSPTADAFSPVTTFGFSVQAALSATDSDLRGSVVDASITVNPVADTPSVTGSATTQNIQSVSGLVISRNDVDGSEVAYFKISNIQHGTLYLNDGTTALSSGDFITYAQGSAGLKFTPALDFTGVASFDVQGSIDNAGTGLSGVATASIAVGTVNPTPTQLVPTDPVTGNPLPAGSPYPIISQSGTLEVRVSIKNTTAFPINGFRLSVDYSAYLAGLPSLRLYNSTSAPGVVPAYIDYPFPVAVGSTVSLKLQFYTSTRRLPNPFNPPLSVTKLSASEVSSTDGSGVQPRIYSLSNGRILLEWDSTPGHWYRVKYSSDLVNWYDSPVPVQAPANRTQWIDDGAPFTDVPPSSVPARYYRVNEISAPTP